MEKTLHQQSQHGSIVLSSEQVLNKSSRLLPGAANTLSHLIPSPFHLQWPIYQTLPMAFKDTNVQISIMQQTTTWQANFFR